MKKSRLFFLVAGLLAVCLLSTVQAAEFPIQDLSGYIMWAPGGTTDNVARSVTPFVEPYLGKNIILQNKTGASGAVAIQWVLNRPSDGYSLLYGAENPQLHKVMGVATQDYDQFYPIILLARDVPVIFCRADAPWKTIQDLIDDAKKRPGEISMGITGDADVSGVVTAMMTAENKVTFKKIPFSGGGALITNVLGGHAQVSIFGGIREYVRSGRIRALTVVSEQPVKGMEEVPVITSVYPGYKKYLPWGAFYGVYVKKDTPDAVKKKLVDAFQKGAKEAKFQSLIEGFGAVNMGTSGDEAEKYLKHWQSVTSWLLYDIKATQESPEKFGIPRP